MDRTGKQGAATALRAVLVINPVLAVVAALFWVWRFSNVLQCFAKLDVTFTEPGKIGAGIGSFRGFLTVAASLQEYTGAGTGKTKHGKFS